MTSQIQTIKNVTAATPVDLCKLLISLQAILNAWRLGDFNEVSEKLSKAPLAIQLHLDQNNDMIASLEGMKDEIIFNLIAPRLLN